MIGKRFGMLVVIRETQSRGNGRRYECLCDCGRFHETQGTNLRGDITQSCGCKRSALRRVSSLSELEIQEIIRLYVDEKKDAKYLGSLHSMKGSQIRALLKERGVKVRGRREAQLVAAHGRIVDRDEYQAIRDGSQHGKLYHRHLMEQHLGRLLTADEVVHHINENKRDNRIDNLEVMSNAEHTRLHRALKRAKKGGTPNV